MSKRLLLSIIVLLLITNIASLLFITMNQQEQVVINDNKIKIATDDTVANIAGEQITYGAWVNELMDSYGKKELQKLIDREVVQQLSEKEDIEVSEKVIEREIALLATMQGAMTEGEFSRLEEGLREDIIHRYQLEKLLTKDIQIPETEVRDFYNIYGNQYNFTEAMQLSHILVPNLKTAEKVKQELAQGASFPLLAKEYSIDEETKKDGGYIGFIHTNSQFFPNGYEEVADIMEEDSYSNPIETDEGVAIIYLHRKLPSIEFTYEEIKPYVESELALKQLDQFLSANRLWDELEVNWIYGD